MNNLTQEMGAMSVSGQSGQTTPRGQGTNTSVAPNAPQRPRRNPTNSGAVGRNLNLTFTGSNQMPGGKYRKRRRKSRKSRRKSRKSKKRRRKKSKKKRRKSRKSRRSRKRRR